MENWNLPTWTDVSVSEGGTTMGRVALQITEEYARQYYRHWSKCMGGADWDELLAPMPGLDAGAVEAAE